MLSPEILAAIKAFGGGSGSGGGVSSWNDLTDKPFGEEADGTIKTLDPKYLPEGVGGDNTFVLTYEADPINGGRVTQPWEDIFSAYQSGKELVLYAYERKWEHIGELAFHTISPYDIGNGSASGLFYIVALVNPDDNNAVVFTSYSITHTKVVY